MAIVRVKEVLSSMHEHKLQYHHASHDVTDLLYYVVTRTTAVVIIMPQANSNWRVLNAFSNVATVVDHCPCKCLNSLVLNFNLQVASMLTCSYLHTSAT